MSYLHVFEEKLPMARPDNMFTGVHALIGLMLVLVEAHCAPVDPALCNCGLLKNRISHVEQSVDLYQTNHDRLASSILAQQKSLDKIVKDTKTHGEFTDTLLERTSEEVYYLGDKYEALYADIDILANVTQTLQHTSGDVQDKVKSFTSQAGSLQNEIYQIKSALNGFQQKYTHLMQADRSRSSAGEDKTSPLLMRKVKTMQRKSDHMSKQLNNARGQTWAMKKSVKSIQRRQSRIQRDILSMRQMSQDNMQIITNQFQNIQQKMEDSFIEFNNTLNERLREMRKEIFNEVMSTAVHTLFLKPAKYILEQGWYPQVHREDWDTD